MRGGTLCAWVWRLVQSAMFVFIRHKLPIQKSHSSSLVVLLGLSLTRSLIRSLPRSEGVVVVVVASSMLIRELSRWMSVRSLSRAGLSLTADLVVEADGQARELARAVRERGGVERAQEDEVGVHLTGAAPHAIEWYEDRLFPLRVTVKCAYGRRRGRGPPAPARLPSRSARRPRPRRSSTTTTATSRFCVCWQSEHTK